MRNLKTLKEAMVCYTKHYNIIYDKQTEIFFISEENRRTVESKYQDRFEYCDSNNELLSDLAFTCCL